MLRTTRPCSSRLWLTEVTLWCKLGKILQVSTSRNCPFKKVLVCILPTYNSNDADSYLQQFQSTIQEVMTQSSDLALQLSCTSENMNGLPNQTLMAIFLRYISNNINKPTKIAIISGEAKLLNMVRYEVMKLENYVLSSFNSEVRL